MLSGRDVSALLLTCKNLHGLYGDEAIWQELCGRHGVFDPTTLGETSFRTLYTELLFAYGGLLGLWASDHPYRGSIIEFRVDTTSRAIVGEVWRFWTRRAFVPADMDVWQTPNLPEFFQFMHVSLSRGDDGVPHAKECWYVHDTGEDPYYGPGTASIRLPTIHIVPSTNLAIAARFPNTRQTTLPLFPLSASFCWYDSSRELPRLASSQHTLRPTPDVLHGLSHHACVLAVDAHTVFPSALMIRPPHPQLSRRRARDVFAPHEPVIPFEDMRNDVFGHDDVGWFFRRFYPLRSAIREGQNPAHDDWHPSSLEGLWLGAYGPHGTEVLYLEYDATAAQVNAWKVTGDLNVPRGACSWTIQLNRPVNRGDLPATHAFSEHRRLYRGVGTICSTGYLCVIDFLNRRNSSLTLAPSESERGSMANTVGIIDEDTIRVNWSDKDNSYTPRYIRYKGRNIATETKTHLLRRPAGWAP